MKLIKFLQEFLDSELSGGILFCDNMEDFKKIPKPLFIRLLLMKDYE